MDIAQRDLGIPAVLEPEYLASPWLDELSGMTYLSYFMKPGSPGFHATLRWVNSRLERQINNFTVRHTIADRKLNSFILESFFCFELVLIILECVFYLLLLVLCSSSYESSGTKFHVIFSLHLFFTTFDCFDSINK